MKNIFRLFLWGTSSLLFVIISNNHPFQVRSLDTNAVDVISYCYQKSQGNYPYHFIYRINSDGTGDEKLINSLTGFNHQDYSPDGTKLVMTGYADKNNKTWSIYVYDISSKNMTRLTNKINVWDSDPSWSPDGSMIAFTRIYESQNMKNETWMMNSDGSNLHFIGVQGFRPKWSIDGSKLIYCSNVSGNWEIYTCNIDGSNEQRILNTPEDEFDPSWSPDGNTILFTSMMDGNYEIYKMKQDGTNLTRLTNNTASEGTPDWSPDGTLIAFVSDRIGAGNFQVFIMNADGSNVNQLTNTPATITAVNPSWRPRQATIVNDKIEKNTLEGFILCQNFPNPFNSSTHINYEVPFEGEVKFVLYNSIGKEIFTFFRQIQPAGKYEINFDATDLASGVYLYSITAESTERKTYTITNKMLLLK
jgi:Tol biopolymer transport system component